MPNTIPRRQLLQAGACAALAASTTRIYADSVNGKLRTAHVGVGGMGAADLRSISSHAKVEVAGLCDVDSGRLDEAGKLHPKARKFTDYREMIHALGDSVDAVVVSTPDHTHAPAAMTAMHHGKPVYCQKPLTHEVFEARQLRVVAEEKQLVTQMGIQVHSNVAYRRAVAMIQAGVIGRVRRVVAWSHKNWGYDGQPFKDNTSPPAKLNWDLWLGTASERAFTPRVYHPGQWRKLVDFGTGTLGDMGVHIFDTPYAALALTAPKWAQTTCRPPTGVGHPEANIVEYEFPGTPYTTETLHWKWLDGAFASPSAAYLNASADARLPADHKLPRQGSLFVGEGGTLVLPHVGEAQLFPLDKFKDSQRPEIPNGNHYHQWVDACMGEGKTSASFSYAGPLTEALLLGVVANRFPGRMLEWDAANLQVTNLKEANQLLRREYRDGFQVTGLS